MDGQQRSAGAPPARSANARTGWPRALAGVAAGALGIAAFLLVTAALRGVLGVRTLPEVLSEGATFYMPWWFFEYMINTFRGQAKVFLMWGIFGALVLAGALAGLVYARWPRPRVSVLLAVGLWLFTLLVALPASGEGVFGGETRAGELPTMAAYAAGWAAFSIVLSGVYRLLTRSRGSRRVEPRAKEARA